MTPEEQKAAEALLKRYLTEHLNGRNDDVLDEFIHPDFVHHTDESALGFENTEPDLAGIKAGMVEMREKLDPTYEFEIVKWEDDWVHLNWTFHGVHRGAVMGLEPTNKPFTIHYTGRTRFKDGRIIDAQNEWDPAATLEVVKAQIYS
ncbi:ester cyclase [Streptomyces kaniharaensis]|uniref:Ester cyclase n=1 Tax=Streptomyces kaniharaensis TaxID=212423 RepID=A0A6N7KXF7_9ACTN|nr:ester cyclase [Streptomyces kaniharaensis]MQS14938.1 ester cyclase [Streptomyces kaniharaensis]